MPTRRRAHVLAALIVTVLAAAAMTAPAYAAGDETQQATPAPTNPPTSTASPAEAAPSATPAPTAPAEVAPAPRDDQPAQAPAPSPAPASAATTPTVPPAAAPVAPKAGLVNPGNLVVTGFSGTRLANGSADTATANADAIAIETEGASLRILDVSNTAGPGADQATASREIATFSARSLGQVFGLTLDDAINPATKAPAPNIYVTATSAYGLNIVLPPATPDGWPRRTLGGDPNAEWMAGQWGSATGSDGKTVAGGPGSVWRIDGLTGDVTLFANIMTDGRPNSGAGLGNIAYDSISRQFFVSDLETGLIHRLDSAGKELGTFDHGVAARPAAKLESVPLDAVKPVDIKAASFRADDPATWGYAHPSRRIWGLNGSAGRLYYAVADGPEIWSVAIAADGGFGDARREILLPKDQGIFEVSDISFDTNGWIYLAERPPVTGNYDYLLLAAQAPAKVLRYRPDPATNAWTAVPDEYPVGLTGEHRQSDGGVAVGYGYKPAGGIDLGKCDGTLWTTGDDLDRAARSTTQAALPVGTPDPGSGINLSGLQGGPLDPGTTTPAALRFADYDGLMPATTTRGHVGDVRVFKTCAEPSGTALATATNAASEAPIVATPGDRFDLAVEKRTIGECRIGGICRIDVKIWNRGSDTFLGPLLIADTLERAGARLISTSPSRWICGQGGAEISCRHPQVEIQPGRSTSLFLEYRLPPKWSYRQFADCAAIGWINDVTSTRVIYAVEIELGRLGFYKGAADGIAGPQLKDAISAYQTAKALAVTGELSRELVEALLGTGILVPGDADATNDRACASFPIDVPDDTAAYVAPDMPIEVIEPPIVTQTVEIIDEGCPEGYWNRGGACVLSCPWGYTALGDICVPIGGNRCSNGWFVGGFCTCPDGYMREPRPGGGSVCVAAFPNRPYACFGGFLRGNMCTCPWGTVATPVPGGLACRPLERVQCSGGLVFGNRCQCPAGTQLIGGRCTPTQPIADCPVGTHRQFGRCVPIAMPGACPPNQIRQGLFCVPARPNPQIRCLAGQVWNGAACVPSVLGPKPGPTVTPVTCPPGTMRRNGNCLPIGANPPTIPTCAAGLVWNGRACVAPIVPHGPIHPTLPGQLTPKVPIGNCPPGTTRIGTVCTATTPKPPVLIHKPEPHIVPHVPVQPRPVPPAPIPPRPHIEPRIQVQPHIQPPPRIQVQPHVQPPPRIQVQPHPAPAQQPKQPACKKFENGRCVQF